MHLLDTLNMYILLRSDVFVGSQVEVSRSLVREFGQLTLLLISTRTKRHERT